MNYFRVLLPIILGTVSYPAHAGYAPPGYVSEITVRNNGVVTFRGGTQVADACQNSASAGFWAFDSTTSAGQATLASLLTAFASHKRMFIGGATNCGVVTGVETVDFLQISDP